MLYIYYRAKEKGGQQMVTRADGRREWEVNLYILRKWWESLRAILFYIHTPTVDKIF